MHKWIQKKWGINAVHAFIESFISSAKALEKATSTTKTTAKSKIFLNFIKNFLSKYKVHFGLKSELKNFFMVYKIQFGKNHAPLRGGFKQFTNTQDLHRQSRFCKQMQEN